MISQDRYIKIISGTGAAGVLAERKLGMRVVTASPLIPPGIVAEFQTASAVAAYFGQNSEEYRRALPYLGFINKAVQKTSAISFTRWVSGAIPPMVVGDTLPKNLNQLTAITGGSLSINTGSGTPTQVTAIDLSSATSLTGVASLLQTAIQAATPSAPQLASASVTYNTNTNQFTLTGSVPGEGVLSVIQITDADLSVALGWSTAGTILVEGQAPDTTDAAISKSAGISNNFGSFVFAGPALSDEQIELNAAWNATQNNQYVYSVAVPLARLGTLYEKVKGYSGLCLNVLSSTAPNDFVEQSPCEIAGSLNFNVPGAAQNFMFYRFPNRNVTVSDDTIADIADRYAGNYIGLTQVNGQRLAFYQRGFLCGGENDATDISVYVNEIWLKSAITAAFMNLLLELGSVQPNPTGASFLLGAAQPVLNRAANNGTFSIGKELDTTQQAYITQVTGDPLAWRQVTTLGYWLDIIFVRYLNPANNRTEYKATYRLVYSKGDSIRAVDGQDIMI